MPLPKRLVFGLIASAVNIFAQAPSFTTTEYPLVGNNYISADLNGDGRVDTI
jgi:hypothetical protein